MQPVITDLNSEIAELWALPVMQTSGRVAKTIVMQPDLRVVLTAVRKGASVAEHQVAGSAFVQTLRGTIALHFQGQVKELPAGSVMLLPPDTAHKVVAQEDSAFLVTIAWHSREK
jgi:quercetin dioxygenase-like cupin family protein